VRRERKKRDTQGLEGKNDILTISYSIGQVEKIGCLESATKSPGLNQGQKGKHLLML
jgi:hypothetical protein